MLLLIVSGCANQQAGSVEGAATGKPVIVATFFPLAQATQAVVGDTATVISLVPAGSEPHDYEPTPSDAANLERARAFVTLGVEFAPFEDQLASSTQATVVRAGANISVLGGFQEEGSNAIGVDPHIWNSPKNMMVMTHNIADQLAVVDPAQATSYHANAEAYVQVLTQLDQEFAQGLANCTKHTVIVNHQAFAYLGRDYNFTQVAISGFSPDSEPTPNQIKKLVDTARAENITYILTESLVDPRTADTIAQETGATTLVLDPLEGTKDPNATYVSIMRDNLKVLRTALDCT
jgi:zinc transport system substrate-binding protein